MEFVVLVLYLSVYFYMCNFNCRLFSVVYFLIFSVCEGSLGLTVLVSIICNHGNDFFWSCSVLQSPGSFAFCFDPFVCFSLFPAVQMAADC